MAEKIQRIEPGREAPEGPGAMYDSTDGEGKMHMSNWKEELTAAWTIVFGLMLVLLALSLV